MIKRMQFTVSSTRKTGGRRPHAVLIVFPWLTEGEKEQTEVKMLWDDTFLYLSYRCDDAHIWAEYFGRVIER